MSFDDADSVDPATLRRPSGSASSFRRARHRAFEDPAPDDPTLRWAAEEAYLRGEIADRRTTAIHRGIWWALVAFLATDIVVALAVIARV